MVHPWPLRAPTWESSPFLLLAGLSGGSLFSPFICFSRYFQSISPSFFFRSVCVRVLRIRHRGRARHRRGCQRVLAGRGWVARIGRDAVAVFVARRRVCLDTRGKHECAPSGLLIWFRLYYVRLYKVRCDIQKNIQAVLIFATKLKINERTTHSEY